MKTGLILEGGAMRGMFTAGVMDVLMEHDISFDGAIGISAGALFGCNYKSRQIGRVIRYNKKYCRDKRYHSFRSWLKTGDLYNAAFCYHELPEKLDLFDNDTFRKNKMKFYVGCTDARTGKAVYHQCKTCDDHDIEWMRGSAAMPLLSNLVEQDGYLLSDGATADSVPIRYFEKLGYDRNVIILTRPAEYIKKKNPWLPLLKIALRRYPNLVSALADRHERYNETISYICQKEAEKKVLVIRPDEPLNIGASTSDPDELERVYRLGRSAALKKLEQLRGFLK